MTRKPSNRKRPQKRGKKAKTKRGPNRRFPGLIPASLLLMAVGLALAVLYLIPLPTRDQAPGQRPAYEDFAPAPSGPPRQAAAPDRTKQAGPRRPMIAIVIDDMGHDPRIDRLFIGLDPKITLAFLPYAPYCRGLAAEAAKSGHEILIHMPMEPDNPAVDPGPGVLTTDMDLADLIRAVDMAVGKLPWAKGINNHMGSRFTADRKAMERFLAVVRSRGLYFLDSRTTAETVAFETARSMGIPALERTVFIDPSFDEKTILHQLRRLERIAMKRGKAVAIGHPHMITYRILKRRLPLLKKEILIVPASRLLQDEG